jgi:hypothetical protein
MGVAVQPGIGAAYEVPVTPDLALGVRAGARVRWAGGSAAVPELDSRVRLLVEMLVAWRAL